MDTSHRDFLKADLWAEYKQMETPQRQQKPQPPLQKPYPEDMALIPLVPPNTLTVGKTALVDLINQRRSRRRFTAEPLSLEELSFLLWATQGVEKVNADKSRTFRTVPSGGARHPFETYLVIHRVEGLQPGLYRYLALEHKLGFLRADSGFGEQLKQACDDFVAEGAAIFIWTALPYRTEWRYGPIAGKLIALDAGHVCQNLYLASEAVGAGTCAIGAYDQKQMDALVGVDGEEEFVVYAAPVGKVG